MADLSGKKVAFLVANEGIEQVELERPREAIEDAGAETHLIAPEAGKARALNRLDKGDEFDVDQAVADVDESDYDALVLPGGVANRDNLRTDEGIHSEQREATVGA